MPGVSRREGPSTWVVASTRRQFPTVGAWTFPPPVFGSSQTTFLLASAGVGLGVFALRSPSVMLVLFPTFPSWLALHLRPSFAVSNGTSSFLAYNVASLAPTLL